VKGSDETVDTLEKFMDPADTVFSLKGLTLHLRTGSGSWLQINQG